MTEWQRCKTCVVYLPRPLILTSWGDLLLWGICTQAVAVMDFCRRSASQLHTMTMTPAQPGERYSTLMTAGCCLLLAAFSDSTSSHVFSVHREASLPYSMRVYAVVAINCCHQSWL
jgi:hypothetical protein